MDYNIKIGLYDFYIYMKSKNQSKQIFFKNRLIDAENNLIVARGKGLGKGFKKSAKGDKSTNFQLQNK